MTYYEILGIKKNASQEEIREAYKTLIKKYHPDLYQGDKSFAEKKAKEINEAYDVLSDSNKKAEYDLEITPNTYNDVPKYSYTPPKYDSTYTGNYNKYSSKYSNYYHSNNYTYNSSKYTNSTNTNSNKSFSEKLLANLSVVFIVFIVYLAVFIGTILQYKSFIKKRNTTVITSNQTQNNLIDKNDKNSEFDINDYFSDSDLRQIYYENYVNDFENFDEFKKVFSIYFQTYYTF